MKHLGDISKINGAEIEPVDIITFGSPCQDLSVAGKRAGLKHEANGDGETTRSGLFMEAVRIIKEMREATDGKYPRFALWENVPGAFSSNKGEDFRIVLEELIKIAEPGANMPAVPPFGWAYADSYVGDGWSLAYRVFDTQYWPRTPQRRRRIYLVADFRGQCARQVLFEREGLRGHLTESPPSRERVTAYVEVGSGTTNCESAVGFDVYNQAVTGDVAKPLTAISSDADHTPVVCVATQQGGAEIAEDGVCPTVTAAAGMSGNNQPWICKPVTYDARGNGDGEIVNTITGDHENRITDYSSVVVEPIPIHDQAMRFSGKHGEKQDGKENDLGIGNAGDAMNTLPGGDRHTVAYWDGGQVCGTLTANNAGGNQRMPDKDNFNCVISLDRAFYNQGQNAQYAPQYYTDGTVPTLVAKGPSAVCSKYIVRRLTPTECARLQGFPDTWGHPEKKDTLSDEEYNFWVEVRNTHAAINGKAVKEYTKDQMLKWHNKLHTDSAEYKMWGNGIALPPTLYCMQGMEEAFRNSNTIEEDI